jgi:hypothetical protein
VAKFKKRNPGCKCCGGVEPCPFDHDTFNRADSGTIGNSEGTTPHTWFKTAGTWDIVSQAVRTTVANARLSLRTSIFVPLDTPESASVQVTGDVKSSANDDIIRLHVDANYYLELKVGASATLSLIVSGTTRSVCNVTAASGQYHTLKIVVCSSTLRGGQFGGVFGYLNEQLICGYSTYVTPISMTLAPGYGTGATVTGNVDCDNFVLETLELWREKQRIVLTGSPTGGTFTMTIPGHGTTSAIAWDANAAAVQTAIESVLGVTTFAPVLCGGVGGAGPLPGTPVMCWLGGAAAGEDVGLMTLATNSLTGGSSPSLSVTAILDGNDCQDCWSCFPALDKTRGTGELTVIVTGFVDIGGGSPTTGCASLNGTYVLESLGAAACSDVITTATTCTGGGGALEAPTPCECYELDVNITVTRFATTYQIDKIRAYGITTLARDVYVEFIGVTDDDVWVRWSTRVTIPTCFSAGLEQPLVLTAAMVCGSVAAASICGSGAGGQASIQGT